MTTKRPPGRPRKELKPHQFSIRLHDADLDALTALSLLYGTSLSGAVERCVRAAWSNVTPSQRRAISALSRAREAAE